jgi:hypothetical protein
MWSWDWSSWRQLNVVLPSLLPGASLAYDTAHKELVLYGGIDGYGTPSSDTYIWDGRNWQKHG